MSGQAIVMTVMKAAAALTALVPEASMYPGDLPQGAPLPAITLHQISGVERNTLSTQESTVHRTERIQATVHASTYTQKKQIFTQLRKSVRYQRGTIAGFTEVSVLPEGDGPDFDIPNASIHQQAKDFMVSYNEPRT